MEQAEGIQGNRAEAEANSGGVTAIVKASVDDTKAQVPANTKKTSDSMYHARQGCGLFWAVGRFRPTNYMIVRHSQQFEIFITASTKNQGVISLYMPETRPCWSSQALLSDGHLSRQTSAQILIITFMCMQLCQRPLNADLKKPNHNTDFIAPMFRNHLMPYR
jgi:hypothetical protein